MPNVDVQKIKLVEKLSGMKLTGLQIDTGAVTSRLSLPAVASGSTEDGGQQVSDLLLRFTAIRSQSPFSFLLRWLHTCFTMLY